MHGFPWHSFIRHLSNALELILPGSCALCHANSKDAICIACSLQFFTDLPARCSICGRRMPHPQANTCGACLRAPPAFDATVVVCDYVAPTDLLVQDLKFRSRLPLAPPIGRMLAIALQTQVSNAPEMIIPVPLSETRLAQRGFNQAAEIARTLSRSTNLPFHLQACMRVRDTQPQAGLPLSERRVNMHGAFAVQSTNLVKSRRVLLVDDVMTTGHTLNELAACLKRHGTKRVTNAVFARTPEK